MALILSARRGWLPDGFTKLEYLGKVAAGMTAGSYIKTDIYLNSNTEFECKFSCESNISSTVFGARKSWNSNIFELCVDRNNFQIQYGTDRIILGDNSELPTWEVKYIGDYITANDANVYIKRENFDIPASMCIFGVGEPNTVTDRNFTGRLYYLRLNTDGEKHDFVPVLNANGEPGMYDKVSKTFFRNQGSGSFIAGMTLKQALKLSKLPATGGTLTVSLPTGYESDEGVVSALETARSNGWTITVQTYTPEESPDGVSTFALRRIWVRRTQDAQGRYVDVDGVRWNIEWCVDMLAPDGSTPDAHGYELFRSQDAAVAYWGIEPWVDPEAESATIDIATTEEERLTNDQTND